MKKEDKLVLGTLAGVDLILSPEHYEEYKGTLNKQFEELLEQYIELSREYDKLENNWNKLKEWMQKELVDSKATSGYSFYLKSWLDKMQEIEGGMNE